MATDRERAIKDGLAALVIAFRADVDEPLKRVYLRVLNDIAPAVVTAAADRLLREAGRRFLPTPAEWIERCAGVIDERRAAMALQVQAMKAKCAVREAGDCVNDFVDTEVGVRRCECHRRGLEMMRQVDAPIARPALPEASEVV